MGETPFSQYTTCSLFVTHLRDIVAQPTIRATAIQTNHPRAIVKAEEEEEVEEDPTKEGEAELEKRVRI